MLLKYRNKRKPPAELRMTMQQLRLICSVKGYPFEARITPKNCKLSSVQVSWARLASFGQLGLFSDPQISSKFQNGINDPKRLENKICTMMKSRETFYGDHTSICFISPTATTKILNELCVSFVIVYESVCIFFLLILR